MRIRLFTYLVALLGVALLLTGCPAAGTTSGGEVVYTPHSAEGFKIVATEGESTILRLMPATMGAPTREVFIARGGESAPKGFGGVVVGAEPQRIVCMSSSHVAFIDALGLTERIVGVSGADYITNPHIRKGVAEGKVREIGYDTAINYELIASLRPDVAFIYGTTGDNTTLNGKLTELGVPYIYMNEQHERSPLGKSEWIVAVGEVLGCREEAEDLFGQIGERYESLRLAMLDVDSRPKVMFNSPYKDVWFVPADKCYIVALVEDAGGDYVCKGNNDSTSSRPISGESAYVWLSQADVWLNPNSARTMEQLVAENPKFAGVDVVRKGRVYNCTAISTPAGGSDFWESGAVWADVVLADMITILHPERSGGHKMHYFESIKN
ncbi:MAG: ABC transporter substrate-binding protein [Tidjanibacter sp.]|nr:ABC transporter substrate-binding protein [Tidjanibacter sp.]